MLPSFPPFVRLAVVGSVPYGDNTSRALNRIMEICVFGELLQVQEAYNLMGTQIVIANNS